MSAKPASPWFSVAAPVASAAVLLGVWQLVSLISDIPSYLFPSPREIVIAAYEHGGPLAIAARQTALASGIGFACAALCGMVCGVVFSAFAWLRQGLYPLANLFQMVPLVAIAPILTIWLGYGLPSTIACSAIVAFFPILANTMDGMRSIDRGLLEVFELYGASRRQVWRLLALPGAVGQIVTGLRVSAGLSVIGAVVGEFVSGYIGDDAPVGILILTALREAKTALVFAAVAVAAFVGFALFGLVNALGHQLLRRWQPSSLQPSMGKVN